jgi:hypothetical protein
MLHARVTQLKGEIGAIGLVEPLSEWLYGNCVMDQDAMQSGQAQMRPGELCTWVADHHDSARLMLRAPSKP